MTVLVPAAKQAVQILGKQEKRANTPYRLFRYCAAHPVEDGLLLFNTMTLELLLLTPEEADKPDELDELIHKWFFVPEKQDDPQLVDQFRTIAAQLEKPGGPISSYTIFTSTNCNARCAYCYEQGLSIRQDMSPDTARRLAQYIIAHSGGEKVYIRWFGGEPLVNMEAIDCICQALADAGIPYSSEITTNGYAFDRASVQKAKDLWRLHNVLIPLDGTEEPYNRIKAYLHPDGSPFVRVMRNIEWLLDAGVRVELVLKETAENEEDIMRLIDQLAARFGGRKNLYVFPSSVVELPPLPQKRSDWTITHSEAQMKRKWAARDRLIQLGLYHDMRLPRVMQVRTCRADSSDRCLTVLPDGGLALCDTAIEGSILGHMDSPEPDSAIIAAWKERVPLGETCQACLFYPQCAFLKKCPKGPGCNQWEREDHVQSLHLQIMEIYQRYTDYQAAEAGAAIRA